MILNNPRSLNIGWCFLCKRFLVFFVPLSLLGIIISGAFYLSLQQARQQAFLAEEVSNITRQQAFIKHNIRSIVSDLMVLAYHHSLNPEDVNPGVTGDATMVREFSLFIDHKKIYDQGRFLDSLGKEVIRVNSVDGRAQVVAKENLQNKRDRYYFQDTIKLKPGEIFVSPFDLNIEQGKIEEPLKPMIRFGASVEDSKSGENIGVVILNYLGKNLLDELQVLSGSSAERIMILNSEGYWLLAPDKNDEWGFMYPAKKELTLAKRAPAVWLQMLEQERGQFQSESGMYTFTTIRPLLEGLRSSTGSGEAFQKSSSDLQADDYFWKVVSFVPEEKLGKYLHPQRNLFILVNVLLALIVASGCGFAAYANVRKEIAEANLTQMATHDNLTGLPNRVLFFDRLEQALARSRRSNKKAAVLFLDLDGFKQINDNYGHEAGDNVLQSIAKRLSTLLRGDDTVARMGGDEFMVVLQSLQDVQAVEQVAGKIVRSVGEPILWKGKKEALTLYVGVSVGVSVFPTDGENAKTLVRQADTAMYRAKQGGKNQYYMA